MASPRSMWSGLIRYGLVAIPVTIAKATSQEREAGIKTVCKEHNEAIDRSERCGAGHEDCNMTKVKAVQQENGIFRQLSESEYLAIEEATKSPTLDVEDVQPLSALPMNFGMGTYYVRADGKSRGSEQPVAVLALALAKSGNGLLVKWSNSTSQKLCVIHAKDGVLMMTQIPMAHEIRKASELERAHFKTDVSPQSVDQMMALFDATKKPEFDHAAFKDKGLILRQQAVDKILSGEKDGEDEKPKDVPVPAMDIMAQIAASMEKAKVPA